MNLLLLLSPKPFTRQSECLFISRPEASRPLNSFTRRPPKFIIRRSFFIILRQPLCVLFRPVWITPIGKIIAAMSKNVSHGHRQTSDTACIFVPPFGDNLVGLQTNSPPAINFNPLFKSQNHIVTLLDFLSLGMAFQSLQSLLRCRFIAFDPNTISAAFGALIIQPSTHFWIAHFFPNFLRKFKIKKIFFLIKLTCLRRGCSENKEQTNYGR